MMHWCVGTIWLLLPGFHAEHAETSAAMGFFRRGPRRRGAWRDDLSAGAERLWCRGWRGGAEGRCRSLDVALRALLGMTAFVIPSERSPSVIPSERSESRDLHPEHER
jgi:hypothetical protein